MTSIQSRIIDSLRRSATHNSDIEVSPVCILWPDKEHQWEAVVPTLQDAIPELYILGDYNPDNRTGPAIWLRCILERGDDCLPRMLLTGPVGAYWRDFVVCVRG